MSADLVDTYLQSAIQRQHIPGLTLAVRQHGVVIKHHAYGLASLEFHKPMTVTTRYPIGALTKMFTGAAIMTLIAAGRLVLTDRVGTILPTLPAPWHAITIAHLLTHTAGLPDLIDPVTGTFIAETREDAFGLLAARPLLSPPGARWQYVQTGYVLLGMVIETLTGRTFATFLTQQFLQPLGMHATYFGDAREIVPDRTSLYTAMEQHDHTRVPSADHLGTFQSHCPAYAYPCAGLNSTVGDLLQWDAALSAGRILAAAQLAEMWAPVTLNDGTRGGMGGTPFGYGYGWIVVDRPEHPWVGHEGGRSNRVWTVPPRSVEHHRVDQLSRGQAHHAAGRHRGALPYTATNTRCGVIIWYSIPPSTAAQP